MTCMREFVCEDLFRFNNINLDPLTETYNNSFYLRYLSKSPEYFTLACDSHGDFMGYIMGKAEGKGKDYHGHVTAVTVAPKARRFGLANKMMFLLESVSENIHNGFFVDLFVRVSNDVAINMYKNFGYSVYRRVLGYYSGEEDAFDMRKALQRDVERKSIIPLDRPVTPEEL
eukprot:CAMPEP_0201489668 /NCGR_PEP_ID=MMETSP0151_2-20130828/23268_1 /ASSEMBLY_ACC=CAM_ASM_000257 /TAXON_ID=200890 /ORGANISM="Paramoeba atlantica, Strain 621/1 / CCAP 1560/9" /LENGTH=171 /DNA_ID=CAMNT_0047875343 /DNA_START=57 /DNA_END=572 /DNA_ORIENTATION=+